MDSSTASSGRVRPSLSPALRSNSSLAANPSTRRSSAPPASNRSIRRTKDPAASRDRAAATESASVWRRLSSSTISATASVISSRSALRSTGDRRFALTGCWSAILMFTSLSEQSTPAELSIKSVLIDPPLRAKAMRAACVTARLAPSPITLAPSVSASTRSRSLSGSPTAALFSAAAFT